MAVGFTMTTSMLFFAPACGDEEPDFALRDKYVGALCRFYVEGDCADNVVASCGGAITFSSEADCKELFIYGLALCTGSNDAINDNADLVNECVQALESFDCVNGQACDADDNSIMTSGACGELDAILDPLCPGDEDEQ